jgi:magnesium transporter
MLTRHSRKGITWIDIETPTREELQSVVEEFGINARIEEEIISPTPYPLVVSTAHYHYLILHFPTTDPRGGAKNQEVDFIVGKNFLITARYEVIESIRSLHKVFEAEELLGLSAKDMSVEHLLERLLRHLYGAIREQTEQAVRVMDRIEEDIFSGKERETVTSISMVGRVLLRFDTTLARHAEPLEALLEELSKPTFFGKEFAHNALHIQAEHDHAASLVASYRAVAQELRNTNDSLLSASQNEIIKRLTIMTFAAFPLTVIASIFGMNATLPFVDSKYGFFFILGIMLVAVSSFILYFRYKKWL